MAVWAIIPVKKLQATKSRLTAVLSASERSALTRHMLRKTLGLLQAVSEIRGVVVVSQDQAVAQIADELGAAALAESETAGLNEAITEGLANARRKRARLALVLPSDLPFLTTADLRLACQAAMAPAHSVVICPDRHQLGTNGLVVPVAAGFHFCFGDDSFRKHRVEAARCRLSPRVLDTNGWRFDLDTVQDWELYQETVASRRI